MNIEIADRLVKLRKEHNLSQEALASKLGLSRQAVSKWERAEASPDTDNLVALAELYGVPLDEILNGPKAQEEDTPNNEPTKAELKEKKLADMCFIQGKQMRPLLKLHILGFQVEFGRLLPQLLLAILEGCNFRMNNYSLRHTY